MNFNAALFVFSFLMIVYLIREAVRSFRSVDLRRDFARLREQRRRRKAARRTP